MLAPQIHLMLNHVPVLGALFATVALAAGARWRNDGLVRFGLVVLVLAALASLPVFWSGGLSEKAVEKLAGVHEQVIERHEDAARVSTLGLMALGLMALVALYGFRRRSVSRWFASTLLVMTLALSGILAWTAHLGGEIRHSEIRNSASAAQAVEAEPSREHE